MGKGLIIIGHHPPTQIIQIEGGAQINSKFQSYSISKSTIVTDTDTVGHPQPSTTP